MGRTVVSDRRVRCQEDGIRWADEARSCGWPDGAFGLDWDRPRIHEHKIKAEVWELGASKKPHASNSVSFLVPQGTWSVDVSCFDDLPHLKSMDHRTSSLAVPGSGEGPCELEPPGRGFGTYMLAVSFQHVGGGLAGK